ncbi:NAD-dependent epimerase/dehydratase family protein [Roseibium sp.]|uniref:NAD-dependent epimerase/dehydratase family protein n=1 Tax=Roseibium sp. TaxID=1936156 RepID=UPI003B52B490
MHILMSGATGQLGRFIAARLRQDGHQITCLGRMPSDVPEDEFIKWDLEDREFTLPSADALVHCALSHVPGKYRDGEGDDPHGFITLNVEGTQALYQAAKAAGVDQCVFLSSRAVYAGASDWGVLTEEAPVEADSFYGQVKYAGELALHVLCDDTFKGTVLRATGIYGVPPGLDAHKWSKLFSDFSKGEAVVPRVGTEVHGEDLAEAVVLLLEKRLASSDVFDVYNVSDILLDLQDLLKLYAEVFPVEAVLPIRSPGAVGVMDVAKLVKLGWAPGGKAKLVEFVQSLPASKNLQETAEPNTASQSV